MAAIPKFDTHIHNLRYRLGGLKYCLNCDYWKVVTSGTVPAQSKEGEK